jgi:transcriptional regulator with XRE-family HTH domain
MTKPLLPHLRLTLASARQKAGASQSAVARVEGVEASNISNFERGKAAWPLNPDARVSAYAEACGTTAVELWRETFSRYETTAATGSKRHKKSA